MNMWSSGETQYHTTKVQPVQAQVQEAETQTKQAEVIPALNSFVAGSVSGVCSIVVGQPFDTIKVRMQVNPMYKSGMDCLRQSLKTEGVASLFKGMVPPIATASVVNAMVFSSYNQATIWLTDNNTRKLTYTDVAIAGVVSGALQCSALSPTELIKCKLQAQTGTGSGGDKYKGVLDCCRQIVRSEGIMGLYSGLSACLVREMIAFGVYFTVYEKCREDLSKRNFGEFSSSFWAGGLAGMSSWAAIYPIDVVKSKIQVSDSYSKVSFVKMMADLYKEKGIRHLYRGLGPTMARAFPVNAVVFPTYELSLYLMGSKSKHI